MNRYFNASGHRLLENIVALLKTNLGRLARRVARIDRRDRMREDSILLHPRCCRTDAGRV
jgi:hypothetical protein